MIENLSATAQNAPPDVKRYSTKEFAEATGLSARTLEDLRSKRKSRLMPAGYDEKGKAYYTADQIDAAKQFCLPAKKLPPVDNVVSLFDSSTNETVAANDYREDDGSNDDPDDVEENIAVVPPADNDDDELQDPHADTLPKTAEAARVGVLAAVDREKDSDVEEVPRLESLADLQDEIAASMSDDQNEKINSESSIIGDDSDGEVNPFVEAQPAVAPEDIAAPPITAPAKLANVTIETPPFIDDMKVVSLAGKTLQELADEGRLCFERADDCLKQSAMYYVEGGRRLIEAKRRLKHGEWQKWLKENFAFSQDTAENRMKVAKRFGESKTFRNLNPSTLIKLLALPEGDEQAFIDEQTDKGKPIESQSARQVQRTVKEWNQQRKSKTKPAEHEVGGEYFKISEKTLASPVVSIITAPELSTVKQDTQIPDVGKLASTADGTHETILPLDRTLIHKFTCTASLADLENFHKELLGLAHEVEIKIGELKSSSAATA